MNAEWIHSRAPLSCFSIAIKRGTTDGFIVRQGRLFIAGKNLERTSVAKQLGVFLPLNEHTVSEAASRESENQPGFLLSPVVVARRDKQMNNGPSEGRNEPCRRQDRSPAFPCPPVVRDKEVGRPVVAAVAIISTNREGKRETPTDHTSPPRRHRVRGLF